MTPDHFINGTWEQGAGASICLTSACTGESRGSINSSSEEQIERALIAAKNAFPAWAGKTLEQRIEILEKYAQLLVEHKDQLARSISAEAGKPHWEALTEAGAMAGKFALSVKAHQTRCAEFGDAPSRVRFKPHGVIVVLGPFNFPGHLPNGHIIPALLAGNTVVFKPSELTPQTAILMLQLLEKAGVPNGVINLLQGGGDIGAALSNHSIPDGIFFTGSSRTGLAIKAANAHNGKILALEMGGNNPLVVTEVADLAATALIIIQSAFLTAGQRCTCARRLILVENSHTDALIQKLVSMTSNITIGPPDAEPAPFMGPVINAQAATSVIKRQEELTSNGAKALLEARIISAGTGFVSPAIIDVTGTHVSDTETFGPLLQIIRVADLPEAIRVANDTAYGLSAGLLSDEPAHYLLFRNQINAGIVNYNQQLTGASGAAPFGGIGISGNHRPSAFFAADYCCYPVASIELDKISAPATPPPGIKLI